MNVDRNTSFGSLEPLMMSISKHIKEDPDPKTNGSRFNLVWSEIYNYLEFLKETSNYPVDKK